MGIVKILVIILGYILMGIMTSAFIKTCTQSTRKDMIMAAAGWPFIWIASAIAFPVSWMFAWFDWFTDWIVDLWIRLENKRFKKRLI